MSTDREPERLHIHLSTLLGLAAATGFFLMMNLIAFWGDPIGEYGTDRFHADSPFQYREETGWPFAIYRIRIDTNIEAQTWITCHRSEYLSKLQESGIYPYETYSDWIISGIILNAITLLGALLCVTVALEILPRQKARAVMTATNTQRD